jgi:hypothetical protein
MVRRWKSAFEETGKASLPKVCARRDLNRRKEMVPDSTRPGDLDRGSMERRSVPLHAEYS